MLSQSRMRIRETISSTFVPCRTWTVGGGKENSNLCELQGKLRTIGKRAHESGAAKEGFMEEVMPEVTTDGGIGDCKGGERGRTLYAKESVCLPTSGLRALR